MCDGIGQPALLKTKDRRILVKLHSSNAAIGTACMARALSGLIDGGDCTMEPVVQFEVSG